MPNTFTAIHVWAWIGFTVLLWAHVRHLKASVSRWDWFGIILMAAFAGGYATRLYENWTWVEFMHGISAFTFYLIVVGSLAFLSQFGYNIFKRLFRRKKESS